MLHRESHISMRPICSDLLFTLVGWIFTKCLKKYLSWLVGVQWRSWTSMFFSTIISMLFNLFEEMVQFWAVIWALGLKKWLESRIRCHITDKLCLWLLEDKPVRAIIGLQSHAWLVMGEILVLIHLNSRLTQGLSTWGRYVCCLSTNSISLRLPRRLNHIIVSSHCMFTLASQLLG